MVMTIEKGQRSSSAYTCLDLFQQNLSQIINHDQWHMMQETTTKRHMVCRRIACTYELDMLQLDPGCIGSLPEATELNELTNKRYNPLSLVFISGWNVNLIMEYHKQ